MSGAHSVTKGKQFERWLAIYYGKEEGHAERTGQDMVETPTGQVQSGVDVRGPFWGAQAKKGDTFWPKTVKAALDKALRDSGRNMPAVMAAPDGTNIDHIVVLRGVDFLRIQKILIEYGLVDELRLGGTFGGS